MKPCVLIFLPKPLTEEEKEAIKAQRGKNKTKKGDVSLAHKVLQEGFKDFE